MLVLLLGTPFYTYLQSGVHGLPSSRTVVLRYPLPASRTGREGACRKGRASKGRKTRNTQQRTQNAKLKEKVTTDTKRGTQRQGNERTNTDKPRTGHNATSTPATNRRRTRRNATRDFPRPRSWRNGPFHTLTQTSLYPFRHRRSLLFFSAASHPGGFG